MPIKNWSTTASNNNSAPPFGFPEGMPPSAVNDAARQLMADVRSWFEDSVWADLGLTPTRVSGTQFTVPGDYTAQFTQHRALRFTGSADAYGTISSSSYGAGVTTVTMASSVIPATLTTVSLATIDANALPGNAQLASGYTAADVLAKLLTVDGPGSGIDADSVDGIAGSAIVRTVNGSSPDGSGNVTVATENTAWTEQATSFTATANTKYMITGNTVTVTLPGSPTDDQYVEIAGGEGVTGCVVGRNGKTIMGLSEDLTVDMTYFSFRLVYRSATGDWRIA